MNLPKPLAAVICRLWKHKERRVTERLGPDVLQHNANNYNRECVRCGARRLAKSRRQPG